MEWIVAVLNSDDPELVHSVSYGDDESSLSTAWMYRCDAEFAKAAAMGLSLFVSAGDNGVATAGDPSIEACSNKKFTPGFPASATFITAVGGTQFSSQWNKMCSTTGPEGTLR